MSRENSRSALVVYSIFQVASSFEWIPQAVPYRFFFLYREILFSLLQYHRQVVMVTRRLCIACRNIAHGISVVTIWFVILSKISHLFFFSARLAVPVCIYLHWKKVEREIERKYYKYIYTHPFCTGQAEGRENFNGTRYNVRRYLFKLCPDTK